MDYASARDLIQDGDLIGVKERGGLIHIATKFFTRSPYTHTGVAIWLQDGLWMAEINGGRNHLIPLSQLEAVSFDVFYCPVKDRECVRAEILDSVRVRVSYSMSAFVVAGACDFFGLKSPRWTETAQICSSFAGRIYHRCGWALGEFLMSPRDLCGSLPKKVAVN